MIQICKWCNKEKPLEKFSKYTTSSGRMLRRATCNACYYKKYYKKKQFGNKYDSRFRWHHATYDEKINHIRLIFEENVIKNKTGCWDWKGKLHRTKYAIMKYEHKQIGAHRISWVIHKGPLEMNDCVLHHCDNKKCTYPEHLYIGSMKDNAIDRERRKRRLILRGENHPNSVLNDNKVKEIKHMLQDGISTFQISKIYKCGSGTIDAIKRNWTWKHVIID